LSPEKLKIKEQITAKINEIEKIQSLRLLGVNEARELSSQSGDLFEAKMGAEAILDVLRRLDLEKLRDDLYQEAMASSGQNRKKVIKRLRVVKAFLKSKEQNLNG